MISIKIIEISKFYPKKKKLHLFSIQGNVSKYIGDEEAELGTNVTHKWLIYVSAKTIVPVEAIVSRARFFLHESYKPNDIIEVKFVSNNSHDLPYNGPIEIKFNEKLCKILFLISI